jgi:aminopeptidase
VIARALGLHRSGRALGPRLLPSVALTGCPNGLGAFQLTSLRKKPSSGTLPRAKRESITLSFEAVEHLRGVNSTSTVSQAAKNVVRNCMRVKAGETVALVIERAHEELGAALLRECEALGANAMATLLGEDQLSNLAFVERLLLRVNEATVSVLLCGYSSLPATFRRQLLPRPDASRRHAHMIGITPALVGQSLLADYGEVNRLGAELVRRLRQAKSLTITSTTGTSLEIRLSADSRWINGSGVLADKGWSNIPGGEVYTYPATVDGILVPDGGVYGLDGSLLTHGARHRLTFERGWLTNAQGSESANLLSAVRSAEHGDRVGQVAFGTNTGVVTSVGELIQDLKMPGFHVSLGYTSPEFTGAPWSSAIEIPLIARRPDVAIDGEPVMVRGRYTREVMDAAGS